ncbi:MAG: GTPase Era, partial [Proteobacteria bacterium]|nr:GTPase Era [Pseudomonadota bacterium]
MANNNADTIYALATPPGMSAVAIIRISGRKALDVPALFDVKPAAARMARRAFLKDRDGNILDDVMLLSFTGPASATGEDVLEIQCHGSAAVIDDILTTHLIEAETSLQRRQATAQMAGQLSRPVGFWREKIARLLAHLEAMIDFADEELPEALRREIEQETAALCVALEQALDDRNIGEIIRNGLSVVLAGPVNAGKSTLSNALVGQKVAIVTQKAQTTRMRLRAVVMHQEAQIILVDTPGIFAAKQRFDRAMVNEAWMGVEDADEVLVVLDAARADTPEIDLMLEGLAESKKQASLVINKIDTVRNDSLLALVAKLNERVTFKDTFLISALSGDGLERLKDTLADSMPEGPWLYPEDQAADIPSLLLASEVMREKLFL